MRSNRGYQGFGNTAFFGTAPSAKFGITPLAEMAKPMKIVYLHGFASSPNSGKALFLREQLLNHQRELIIPDLNLGNFGKMTITKVLNCLQTELGDQPLIVIGSSLGGFLAVQWTIVNPLIERLILLAPALNFPTAITSWLGEPALNQWREEGDRAFFHYGEQKQIPLHFEFYVDAQKYANHQLSRQLPITILHGKQDVVVPPQVSIDFAEARSWVKLHLLESDHSLGDSASLALLWQEVENALSMETP
jgi:pimeloyl-ACP methyl ester carboxylesterase